MRIRFPKLLCLSLLVATQAHAEDGFFSNMSLLGGVSVGQSSLDRSSFVSPATGYRGFDGKGTAWTPSVGLEINRYLSVDLGRFNGGSPAQTVAVSAPTPGIAGAFVSETDKIVNSGWLISAMGSLPLNEVVSVYARGGILSWKTTTRIERIDDFYDSAGAYISTTYQYFKAKNSGSDPFYGLGIALNIDGGMVRLEYDQSTINDADLRYISIGFVWKFKPWH